MTLTQLQYAIVLGETLNFNEAAKRCHVAQPSLSQQIQKLESDLGVQLFDRSARSGVRVTDVGREVLLRAKKLLQDADSIRDYALSVRSQIKGVLRVGVIPTVAPFLLPYFLRAVTQDYPELQLEIFEKTTHEIMPALGTGQLDVAILSTPKSVDLDYKERVLYYEPFCAYVGRESLHFSAKNLRLAQLKNDELTLLDETHCMRDQVVAICGLAKKSESKQGLSLQQGSLQSLITVVEATGTLTLVPVLATRYLNVQDAKGFKEIVANPPFRKISLLTPPSFSRQSLLKALTETILKNLPDEVSRTAPAAGRIFDPDKSRF